MEMLLQLLQETDRFLVLSARFSGLIFAPVFNAKNLPSVWKIFLIIILSFFAWGMGTSQAYVTPENTVAYMLVLASEITLGFLMALVMQFVFAAIQLAGEIIDIQMGLGIMNVLDPLSGLQTPLVGNFKFILAMLVYLQVDGHHLFIQAIMDSYRLIPIGHLAFPGVMQSYLLSLFGGIFVIALKLCMPVIGSLLVTDIILGIMSRTIPQMNVFMVGMPTKILLGFGIMLATMPLYIYLLNSLIENSQIQLYQLLKLLQ